VSDKKGKSHIRKTIEGEDSQSTDTLPTGQLHYTEFTLKRRKSNDPDTKVTNIRGFKAQTSPTRQPIQFVVEQTDSSGSEQPPKEEDSLLKSLYNLNPINWGEGSSTGPEIERTVTPVNQIKTVHSSDGDNSNEQHSGTSG